MSRLALAVFSLAIWGSAQAQVTPAQAMARVGEEAAVFQENLPKTIAQETLTQQALLAPLAAYRIRVHGAMSSLPNPYGLARGGLRI